MSRLWETLLSRLPNCGWFLLEYQVFFIRLYRRRSIGDRGLAMAACGLMYLLLFGWTGRDSYALVLFLHLLLALSCALLLYAQLRLQPSYALFLGFVFLLTRSFWNAQIISLLLPSGLPDVALVQNILNIATLYIFQRCFIRMELGRSMGRAELFVSLLPSCATFGARVGIYHYCYYLRAFMEPGASAIFSRIGAFLGFSTLVSLAATEIYFSRLKTQQELERAKGQLNLQYRIFQEQRQNDEKLKRVYHDMANHLQVLRQMYSIDAVKGYIGEIHVETAEALNHMETGNAVLDLILHEKARECRQRGLSLEAAVSFPHGDFLSQMEICTLFSNCIDNAMEAATAEGVRDKTILLSGSERHGCLVMRFENAYAHTLRFGEDKLLSTKGEGLHGYGLENVRAILEKHDGTLSIQAEEGRFILTWMLPLPA